ncbi:MAG: tRNA-guanine transglycosylase, partial [Candidatus Poseidoniia archaeon]
MSAREDPQPCREQDFGKFEVVARDGAARLGRLHTRHGVLDTPMLLPVVNPNIRTIEPREMWEKYHVDALITNSYVAWKHEKLREPALADGIHALLDFPSVIVTDSGTFQSYVYGDVEVGVEEIIEFQRDIGVDIGTMLDVFGRPDMSREEL